MQDNKYHRYRFRAPPIELNKNKQKLPLTVGFRALVAHVALIGRTGTLPRDQPFRSCIRRQLCQYGCLPTSRPHGFPLSPFLASCVRRKKQTRNPAAPKAHHEILSSPATATTYRRRATKRVSRVSPYLHASIVSGFVEIGLVQLLQSV